MTADPQLSSFIGWLIVGFIAGMIIHLVDQREVKGGFLATTVSGILGAFIGGFLSSLLFSFSIAFAAAGGLILAFIQRIITDTKDEVVSDVSSRNRALEQQNDEFIRSSNPVYYSQVYPSRYDEPEQPARTAQKRNFINPIEVQRYLEGVDYPADKNELIKVALRNGADEEVIYTLEHLPEDKYYSPVEINQDLGFIQ
jgi:uncharacterized membrane protein YeaQ/YmgE (transglycosylase-associated protein family)